jgi:hypothetical protein
MVSVILDPGNPLDFSESDLNELAGRLKAQHEAEVEIVPRPERGYGVTFHEVMNIWVNVTGIAGGTATGVAILRSVAKWARERWHKDRDEHPGSRPRPRSVTLYGPDGRAIKTIEIDEPSGEPIEREPNDLPPRTPPKL